MNVLYVGIGGLLGSIARYGLVILCQQIPIVLPMGTLLSNLLGCLVIGAVMELVAQPTMLSMEARLFLATGFCGGFTTLSAFIYELSAQLKSGDILLASGYFAATLGGAALCFALGALLGKMVAAAMG